MGFNHKKLLFTKKSGLSPLKMGISLMFFRSQLARQPQIRETWWWKGRKPPDESSVWVRVATQDHSDEGHIQRLINFHDQILLSSFGSEWTTRSLTLKEKGRTWRTCTTHDRSAKLWSAMFLCGVRSAVRSAYAFAEGGKVASGFSPKFSKQPEARGKS